MANLSTAAGNGGVGGTESALPSAVTGAYGTAYSDNGNLAVAGNAAVRRCVARTSKSAPTTASKVFSETQGFRTAYSGVEVDSPALDASRT
jgi:hypothetical protein